MIIIIIITSTPLFATYRAKVEHRIVRENPESTFSNPTIFFGGASCKVLMAVL